MSSIESAAVGPLSLVVYAVVELAKLLVKLWLTRKGKEESNGVPSEDEPKVL